MKFLPFLLANLKRRPARLLFTSLTVVVAFVLFGLLSATREAFTGSIDLIGANRLITVNNVSFTQPLPISYERRIAGLDGVEGVATGLWLQGYYQDPRNFLPVIAGDLDYLTVYPEIVVSDEERRRWAQERTGAIIGRVLAEDQGWRVGDRVPIHSAIYQHVDGGNTWETTIAGIYTTTNRAFDEASMILRYDYFNESRTYGRDQVNWFVTRVSDSERAPEIARRIDDMFANSAAETESETEKAWAQSMIAQFGDIGAIVTGIVSAVFFSMLLVIAVTMAQSVRERRVELAVLKALGFTGRGLLGLVLAESALITMLGAGLGLGLAYLASHPIRDSVAQFLPNFFLKPDDMAIGIALALALGLLAGLWPAAQALRLRVINALREA